MPDRRVGILTETIELEAFLKWAGVSATGGEAKREIQRGQVRVNGLAERRRGRRLVPGDRVRVSGHPEIVVVRTPSPLSVKIQSPRDIL